MKRILPILLICSNAFGVYLIRLAKPEIAVSDPGPEYLTYSNGADIIHYDDAYWNGTTCI